MDRNESNKEGEKESCSLHGNKSIVFFLDTVFLLFERSILMSKRLIFLEIEVVKEVSFENLGTCFVSVTLSLQTPAREK